jgi:hypothetical protein
MNVELVFLPQGYLKFGSYVLRQYTSNRTCNIHLLLVLKEVNLPMCLAAYAPRHEDLKMRFVVETYRHYSWHRHSMEVTGQLQGPATLSLKEDSPLAEGQEAGWTTETACTISYPLLVRYQFSHPVNTINHTQQDDVQK